MRTVWKFPLQIIDEPQPVKFPGNVGAAFVDVQNGQLCLWVEVNTESSELTREFVVVGTGQRIPPEAYYVGSAQAGPFVWHVYGLPLTAWAKRPQPTLLEAAG